MNTTATDDTNLTSGLEMLIPHNWEVSLAAVTIFSFAMIGISAYMPILYVFAKYPKDFFDKPYYRLSLSLSISDLVMLSIFVFYTPISIYTRGYPLGVDFDRFLGVLCNLSYFAGLTCFINIAINRYFAVCRFKKHALLYTVKNTNVLFFINWSVGFLSCIPQMLPCCYLQMWPESFSWGYDMDLWGNEYYIWYDRAFNILTFSTLIVCYWFIIKTLRGKKLTVDATDDSETLRRAKQERSLAVQFLLIGLCLIIFGLGFTLIPAFTLYHWHLYATSFLYIVNLSLNPLVYLFLNSAIRNRVLGHIPSPVAPSSRSTSLRSVRLQSMSTSIVSRSARSASLVPIPINQVHH